MNVRSVDAAGSAAPSAGLRIYDPCGRVDVQPGQKLPATRVPDKLDGLRPVRARQYQMELRDDCSLPTTSPRSCEERAPARRHRTTARRRSQSPRPGPAPRDRRQQATSSSWLSLIAGPAPRAVLLDSVRARSASCVPTAVIVTTEFVHESRDTDPALGMHHFKPAVIDHPLSALSTD